MAYIEGQDDEEKQQQQQGQDSQPLQLSSAAPGAATGSTPAPAPATPGQPPPSQDAYKAPGRSVNFQQYFNANRDAATAAGNQVASGIQAQGDAVNQDLQGRQNSFQQGINTAEGRRTLPNTAAGPSPTAQLPAAMRDPGSIGGATPPPAPAPKTPTAVGSAAIGTSPPTLAQRFGTPPAPGSLGSSPPPTAPTALQPATPAAAPAPPVANFAGQAPTPQASLPGYFGGPATAGSIGAAPTAPASPAAPPAAKLGTVSGPYTGPTSLAAGAGWDDLLNRAGQATDAARIAGTPSGLQALLQQQNQGATPGMNRFDAGLVGAASGDTLRGLAQRFSGLQGNALAANTASQAQGDAAKAAVNAKYAQQQAAAAAVHGQQPQDAYGRQGATTPAQDHYGTAGSAQQPTSADPTGTQVQSELAKAPPGIVDSSQKGQWNQLDPAAAVGGQPQTDAGAFAQVAKSVGITGNDAQALYAKLSQQDIEELRWILRGPDAVGGATRQGGPFGNGSYHASSNPAAVYPDYRNLPPGATYDAAVADAKAKWMARMQKKYSA